MDFNFFEPYKKIQPKTNFYKLLVLGILLLGVVGLLVGSGYNYLQINQLDNSIKEMKADLESPQLAETIRAVKEKEEEVETIKKEKELFDTLDIFTRLAHVGSPSMINNISNNMSDNISLRSIYVVGSTVKIQGYSYHEKSIALFESNLRESGKYVNVFVDAITKENLELLQYSGIVNPNQEEASKGVTVYSFTLTAKLDLSKNISDDIKGSDLWFNKFSDIVGGGDY